MSKRALAGVKVLEYAQFVAGPYCAKLLADLGAEVIKIEEPKIGDEARRREPFLNDVVHPERSGLFLYLNTNKLGITLNLNTATGKNIFKELVKEADILIEDKPAKTREQLELDYQSLSKINPRLIMTSITPFGQTGPYAEYKAYYLNNYHSGALGYLTPRNSPNLDRAPLKAGGMVGEYACGLSSALATLAALYSQRITGVGQHIDASKQETLISLQRVYAAFYPNEGINPTREYQTKAMGGLMQCKDGYIAVTFFEEHQWSALVKLMGDPEWAQDERYKDMGSRIAHCEEIEPLISQWMLNHTREEIYHRAQALSIPTGPVLSAEEIVSSEQAKARGFFSEIEHPEIGRVKIPSAPYQFSETPWAVEHPAPLLGEHNEEVYCQRLGYSKQDLVKLGQTGII
jgi:crotonobetainyl-CoA:carnitine CoA-transferase CaiB-like acyl-CoA transferase